MCGISGFWTAGGDRLELVRIARGMSSTLHHRGPDDSGEWVDESAGIALAHRRLSILDLSPAGHQPMTSSSGRFVIVYNGEIYNHHAIRAEMEECGAAPAWRGHSDTEILLAAIDRWGVEGALARLNGMFAFAVWDRQDRSLILARDRLGEKPLYYGAIDGAFIFGSELKALTAHPSFERDVDRSALALFIRFSYVPTPHSIWHGIKKLPPAHYVVIRNNGRQIGEPQCFWDFHAHAKAGSSSPFVAGSHLVDELEVLLKDAVALRMRADVPLGAFLSGGVDSSAIVAMMQVQSARPVRTFAIGFQEKQFDESAHARAVAAHLGTDHTELYVSPRDALDVIPKLPSIWDEPFSDSSQIPTYLISALTRQHVNVSLSGDGGDELFGGYNRYLLGMRLWQNSAWMPRSVRQGFANILRSPKTAKIANGVVSLLPARFRHRGLADRLPKVAQLLEAGSPQELHRRLVSHWEAPDEVVVGGREPETELNDENSGFEDFRATMMYLDAMTYLPDDILAKVDRASMAVSLESRVPFLDHRIVEFAWKLPMAEKIRGGVGKQILREVLYRHVPRALIERPKMGFGVPIDSWLTGALRDWVEDLLDERRLYDEGFFNPTPIRCMWEGHKAGTLRGHHYLWDILMFQAWWQEQRATMNAQRATPAHA